jgi:hypothetical protein
MEVIADPKSLVVALRKQLTSLEYDLGTQSMHPQVDRALRERWRGAREAPRTLTAYEPWRDEQVNRGAVAWLLATVLIRFCEDNGLISEPFLAGPGERLSLAEARQLRYERAHPDSTGRDWILDGLGELNASGVVAPLLDPDREPMRYLGPSDSAAQDLISFWRTRKEGQVIFDFTNPELDTSFLSVLYQDLSEQQSSRYALLETPEFIANFILDYSLEPAIAEFGLDELRTIDPVCGSGTFLLSAFQRLLRHRGVAEETNRSPDLVRRCLRSVHGADKNPMAVAIARFRLLVEAMQAFGATVMSDAPVPDLVVVEADSLLCGRDAPGSAYQLYYGDAGKVEFAGHDLLGERSYHAVFGNPPYITPKDKAEAAAYRSAYPDCIGQYALTVPFIERFFGLGMEGYVGLLVANSFMKREFGRSLVERFLPTIDLTHVIDTSGVFIPRHGIPTAILLGRSRQSRLPTVEVVTNLRGEPEVPADPAHGKVWSAIRGGTGHVPYRDEWVQVLDIDRASLSSFPWNFADEVTGEVLHRMERGTRLGERTLRIGYYASTGSDEIFTAPPASFRRIEAERERVIPVITGSEVRDWRVLPHDDGAMFSEADKNAGASDAFPVHMRRLWPYRTVLEHRSNYSGRSYLEDGRLWYSWHHITETPEAHPWSVVFSWVSTHNHFAVLRDRAAPLNSAPVIRLPSTASDSDVVQLAALLNSSLACFWLKQYSNSKGQPRAEQTGTGEPWTIFYEFTGTRLADFPLPPDRWSGDRWSAHAEELDRLAQELAANAPRNVLKLNSAATTTLLDTARSRWENARARIVALQEELDWDVYERYGIVNIIDDLSAQHDSVPNLAPGERAFEIALARRVARGEINTTWFERHAIEPVTEIPSRWSARYRKVVANRIELIEHMPTIGLIEQPEFKRRWAYDSWEAQEGDAIRSWILDRCEQRNLWYRPGSGGELQPHRLSVQNLMEILSGDTDLVAIALRLAGDSMELGDVIAEMVRNESVPYLAALRHTERGLGVYERWVTTWLAQIAADENGRRSDIVVPPRYSSGDFRRVSYWKLRGKFDVPNERFISYPDAGASDELMLGWAGWTHSERVQVLIDQIEADKRRNVEDMETIIPRLAGLREELLWLRQWHKAEEQPLLKYLEREQRASRLSDSELAAWRPPKPRRGRPRKQQ